MSSRKHTVSVITPVRNVEDRLPRFLDALTWVDEVVLVDQFSTDRTVEIAARYPNVTFIQSDAFVPVNYNLGQERARGGWILRLDSDEIPSPELRAEIESLLALDELPFDGYYVPQRVYFFGKWIRYGMAYHPAAPEGCSYRKGFYRKGVARYPGRSYHDDLESRGRWGYLKHPYDHYSHASVSEWIAKMNHYTDGDLAQMDLSAPGFVPPRPWRALLNVPLTFINLYFFRKGYRDGLHGVIICGLNSIYQFVQACKIWEACEKRKAA
ncbi:MAG: glycosyltransferase family 2 protein [Armatimonadetes bacterium]|nr:glycosyltransferase family 2 protein [Armatimonadota bacterium]